jgi:hypothetical protein
MLQELGVVARQQRVGKAEVVVLGATHCCAHV